MTIDIDAQPAKAAQETQPVTLVDVDIHPEMPLAEYEKRLPKRWLDHLNRYWMREPMITDVYPRSRNQGWRADSWPEDGEQPGSNYELLRAQLLDEHEIDFGVLLCLDGSATGYEHPDLDISMSRAVNDWIVEEWLDRDDRLRSSIAVPHDHPAEAVKEIERVAGDDRFVQVLLPASAQEPFGSRKYWPIYAAASEAGLPVAFHTGGHTKHSGAGWPSYYLEEHVGYSVVMQVLVTSLIAEGTFAAIPGLRVVITEGGALWAPALGWRLDAAFEKLRDEVPELERLPSEYMRDHVWYDTQPIEEPDDPADFARILEQGRLEDRLMFATDYPHWDFDSPSGSLPAGLSKDLRHRIMAETACDLFGLPKTVPVR